MGGEGGGKAIGVRKLVIRLEFGGAPRESDVSRGQGDRKLSDPDEHLLGEPRALISPNGIVDFAPVDHAHEEFALAVYGEAEQFVDFGSARAVVKKGQQSAGVHNNAFHG